MRATEERFASWVPPAVIVGALAAMVSALALIWLASEAHYRGCIDRVATAYPAVPVSAYVGRDKTAVGPLKVSFVDQRSRAVRACRRL